MPSPIEPSARIREIAPTYADAQLAESALRIFRRLAAHQGFTVPDDDLEALRQMREMFPPPAEFPDEDPPHA